MLNNEAWGAGKSITLLHFDLFVCFSVTQSESDRSCILLLRLQKQDGGWVWVHTVLQVKENLENSQSPVIVCTNQVLRYGTYTFTT